MGMGPIPWTTIMDYAERRGFEGELAEAFVCVIEAMDGGYLAWQRSEADRARGGS